MRRAAIAVAVLLVAADAAADGLPAPAPRATRESACVAIDAAAVLEPRARAKLATQLAAALGQHGIAACAAGDEPLARVAFEAAGGGEVAIRVRVEDAVTRKELARIVKVGVVPPDGRPLALAVAADELLRASWAEIALTRAPDPPPPAPAPVRAVVRASLPEEARPARAESAPPAPPAPAEPPREPARAWSLGFAVAGEHAAGGLTQAGFDVRGAAWVLPRLALTLRLGARASPRAQAPDGEADTTGLLAGGGAAIALVPRGGAISLDVPLRVDAERLQVTGHAAPGARAASGVATGVFASAGADLGWRASPALALDVEVTVGLPLRAVEATDAQAAFTALSSAIVGVAIGARVSP